MEIVTANVNDLNPASYNPRKELKPGDIEYEQIKQSILSFGMVEPIVWNRRTKNIVAGHQRFNVLRDLGYETVDVSVIDVDAKREKALNIALNKITGQWDEDKLTVLLEELTADTDDMLISLSGFTEEELDDMFSSASTGAPEWEGDEEEAFDLETALNEASAKPITERGDIYLLGDKHRVMCGDSTRAEDIDRLMDGREALLTITDPPYNAAYTGKTPDALKMQNDAMKDEAFSAFLLSAFENIHRVIAAGAAAYIFHSDRKGLIFRSTFEAAGFITRQCLIWVKNTLVLGRQDYQWRHEPILYGWKDGSKHYFTDDRTQTTVIEHDRPTVNDIHPTMKPVTLIERLIVNSSLKGWLVLDPFGGSGSTLIAADKLGRPCCLMELDERYCDVIVNRYIEHVGNAEEVMILRGCAMLPYSELAAGNN